MSAPPTHSSESPLQLLFLGTGTSTGLPLTPCLTLTQPYPDEFAYHLPLAFPRSNPPPGHFDPEGEWPNNIPCACCRAAVSPDVPEGWKNRRGNTSVIVRKQADGGGWKNVIVDVGKTFREQSSRFFPRWGVDRIDAVILTHGHADAYYGLDDLREWCFRQECIIPVYLNRETYETVATSFPYLVDRKKASGGGDVPALRFHIIEDDADFEVEGIRVRALPVEHGIYFQNDERKPLICLGFMFDESIIYMSDVSEIPERTWSRMLDRTPPPLSALTVFNENNLSQPSETSYESPNRPKSLPERLKDKIENATTGKGKVVIPPTPDDTPRTSRSHSPDLASLSLTPTTSPPASSGSINAAPLPVLIIDSLWALKRHSSHIHFVEALRIAMRLKPAMTYLVDLVHPLSHYMWEELCYSLKGENGKRGTEHPDDEQARELIGRFWNDRHVGKMKKQLDTWEGRVEPGWDGLVIEVEKGGWKVVEGKKASGRGIAL